MEFSLITTIILMVALSLFGFLLLFGIYYYQNKKQNDFNLSNGYTQK